jgi:hypothetical protein
MPCNYTLGQTNRPFALYITLEVTKNQVALAHDVCYQQDAKINHNLSLNT